MKIALIGTHCNGKSTLVEAIKKNWPMYKSPKKTYRDIIAEKNIKLNREGDQASQEAILDALCQQAHDTDNETHVIHDRVVTDNLAYTMYLADKGIIEDEAFIVETILRHKDAIKKYDIVFWLPLNSGITLDDINNPNRDTDTIYRIEIDNIFSSIYESYQTSQGLLFDLKDQPLLMRLDGDLNSKIEAIADLIGADGNLVETEKSVLTTMEEEFDRLQLMQQLVGGKTE
jgi:thymidylate kinase